MRNFLDHRAKMLELVGSNQRFFHFSNSIKNSVRGGGIKAACNLHHFLMILYMHDLHLPLLVLGTD
jgi:hypothetical protein